jgi:hypothetical protein
METVNLPSGVTLDNIGTSIYFTPPAPKTYINDLNSGNIYLTFTVNGSVKSIFIESNGNIDIE